MTTDPNRNQKQEEPSKNSSWKRIKSNVAVAGLVCAIIFVVLYGLVNIRTLNELTSSALDVLTPILLGVAIAYLLNPILKIFEYVVFKKIKNTRVLRGLSLSMTYVVAILIIVGFLFLLIPQLIESIKDFVGNFNFYVENTSKFINDTYSNLVSDGEYHEIIHGESLIALVKGFISNNQSLFDNIKEYGMGLVVGIKNTVLAIFISIYVLSSKERLKAQTKKLTTALFSETATYRFYRYLHLCHQTFGGFFIGKIVDSLIIGVITLVTLLIFQMPYVLLVSTIVCITNVIPVFGPFIGAIPSFIIIFIKDPVKALIFLVLILLIQQLDGNVIGPKILGDSTGLSSLGVIISIVIMGSYFGIIGMILGVPIFAVVVAIVKEFLEDRLYEKKRPIDTADYYEKDSLVDPRDKHEKLFLRALHPFATLFRKIVALFRRTDKKKKREKDNL
ncbi:MAG: AI-2E family transporter [Clostridia bacterium]|nr:AI-2E family transporter [Clostridia bacterium]